MELTDPILQRFDVLCILQDVVDPLLDNQLGNFVVASHRGAACVRNKQDKQSNPRLSYYHPGQHYHRRKDAISQDILRKYVAHARVNCRPRLQSIDQDKISRLYADLRRESATCGGIPIAVRHLESLMRMAEAQAKVFLREHVWGDDVDNAIIVLITSFINSQKTSVRSALERGFRKYLVHYSDLFDLLLHALRSLMREAQTYAILRGSRDRPTDDLELDVLIGDFEAKVLELNYAGGLEEFYTSKLFEAQGFRVDRGNGLILWSAS